MSIPRLIAIILISLLIFSCDSKLTKTDLIERTEVLLAEKQYAELEVLLKEYLTENSQDQDIRALLGITLARSGKFDESISQLRRAESSKLPEDAFNHYISAMYYESQADELVSVYQRHADRYKLASIVPAAYLHALTISKQTQGDTSEFVNLQQQFSDEQLYGTYPMLGELIDATVAFGENKQAASFLSRLIEAKTQYPEHINSPLFLSIAGNIAYAELDFDNAEYFLSRFNDIHFNYHQTKLMVAEALYRGNRKEEAEAYVDNLLKSFPKQPILNQLRAFMFAEDREVEKAKSHIETAIDGGFSSSRNLLLAGALNFSMENYERAINFLERGLKGSRVDSSYSLMLNYAKARTSDNLDIQQVVDSKTIDSLDDIADIGALIKGLADLGNTRDILSLVENIQVNESISPIARLEVALLKREFLDIKTHEIVLSSASEVVSQAVGVNEAQSNKAKAIYLSALLESGDVQKARAQLGVWESETPNNAFHGLLKAELDIKDKQFSDALNILNSFENKEQIFAAQRLMGVAHFNLGKFDLAEQAAFRALDLNNQSLEALRDYATIISADESLPIRLQQIYPEPQSNEFHSVMLSLFYSMVQDYEKAAKSLEKYSTNTQKSIVYYYTLVETYLSAFEREKAFAASQELARLDIVPVGSVSSFVASILRAGNDDGAIQFLQKQVANYPKNSEAAHLLALSHLKARDAESALKVIKSIPLRLMTQDMQLTHAEIVMLSGDVRQSQTMYERVYQRYTNELSAIRLANFYINLGKKSEAVKLLNTFISNNPKNVKARLMLASHSDSSESITLYKTVLSIEPLNVFALNNLAWAFHLAGNNQEALPLAKEAVRLSPSNPDIRATLESVEAAL